MTVPSAQATWAACLVTHVCFSCLMLLLLLYLSTVVCHAAPLGLTHAWGTGLWGVCQPSMSGVRSLKSVGRPCLCNSYKGAPRAGWAPRGIETAELLPGCASTQFGHLLCPLQSLRSSRRNKLWGLHPAACTRCPRLAASHLTMTPGRLSHRCVPGRCPIPPEGPCSGHSQHPRGPRLEQPAAVGVLHFFTANEVVQGAAQLLSGTPPLREVSEAGTHRAPLVFSSPVKTMKASLSHPVRAKRYIAPGPSRPSVDSEPPGRNHTALTVSAFQQFPASVYPGGFTC